MSPSFFARPAPYRFPLRLSTFTLPFTLALAASSCQTSNPGSTDGKGGELSGTGGDASVVGGAGGAQGQATRLVVVTERESPEVNAQYLHLLEDWPESGQLDYQQAIEFGQYLTVRAQGDSVYIFDPEDSSLRRLRIGAAGVIGDDRISFSRHGLTINAEIIWESAERAFVVDEGSAQIVRFDPSQLKIETTSTVGEEFLSRGDFNTQFQQGVASGGKAFTAVNWRDWTTYEYEDRAAIGWFDTDAGAPEFHLLESAACAPTVALSPFDGDDGYVYLMSDAALGFDALASPFRTEKPLCVLRVSTHSGELDDSFRLDLREVIGTPGFYTAHPMTGGKLLVHAWAPDVAVEEVADAESSDWYWATPRPPYFEYHIVDLKRQTAVLVEELPRAGVQFSSTLRVDGKNYVQLYRDDNGSDLFQVEPDGSTAQVLSNGSGSDVQYLGRVELVE
jgi:hypothetical protein